MTFHPALYHPRPERWLTWRFSLRTLFIVVTIFGVWLGSELHVVRDRAAMREWLVEHEARFDVYLPENPRPYFYHAPELYWQKLECFSRVRLWLGDQPMMYVCLDDERTRDGDYERVQAVFPEASVTRVHDALKWDVPGLKPRRPRPEPSQPR